MSEDRGLIHYLLRHRHTTPFEMCEIKFHVKLPIFVARQWIRHRTANVNEYSARYSILDHEFYVPDALLDRHIERRSKHGGRPARSLRPPEPQLATALSPNKQGRDDALPAAEAADVLAMIKDEVDARLRAPTRSC